MKLLERYFIIDTDGDELPSVEILASDGIYIIDNLDLGTEVMVESLSAARDVARALRNRNQRNYNKGV